MRPWSPTPTSSVLQVAHSARSVPPAQERLPAQNNVRVSAVMARVLDYLFE